MNTLIYFILFTVGFYYIFKFSVRLLLPFAMRKLTERMMKKAQQGSYQYSGSSPFEQSNPFGGGTNTNYKQKNSDGKVRVDYMPQQEEKRKGTSTAGEFIDFEEVK